MISRQEVLVKKFDGSDRGDVTEITYGVTLSRSGVVPLRWLDRPAREYVVQHYENGTIEVRPLGKWNYVVKATEDDVLELKTTGAGVDYIEVRHRDDGTIWLRPKEAARRCGNIDDKWVIWKINPGCADDYVLVHEYAEQRRDIVLIERRADNGRSIGTELAKFIHDDWDRTYTGKRGLHHRPRELIEQERRERMGEKRWQEFQKEEEERRQLQRAYREKRKAIAAGLLPPTPRLLKQQQKQGYA